MVSVYLEDVILLEDDFRDLEIDGLSSCSAVSALAGASCV